MTSSSSHSLLSLPTLKEIKNSVIGNPSAKLSVASDLPLLAKLLQCLSSHVDAEAIEAAHIIASISYGSSLAIRNLARQQAIPAVLHALAGHTIAVNAALARALKALASALAECVGPGLWGIGYAQVEPLGVEEDGEDSIGTVRREAAEALDVLFHVC